MTIAWGNWSSNNRLQAGVEVTYSPTTITTNTVSVTVTARNYLRSRYASYETGSSTTWWITGTVANSSGNTDWNVGDMGYVQMGVTTQTVNLTYGSTQSRSGTARIHSYYAYPGTEATATQSITIPARPYAVPSAPSGVTGTRNSDTQATASWTRNATTGAPYSSQDVEMNTMTGGTWGGWVRIVSGLSGTATSYVRTGLSANHKYQFRVRANNSAGSSGWGTTSTDVYMTPGAPSNVSSSVAPSGATITTSWTNTAYTSSTITHEVQRSVNGGAYANVVTGLAQGTTTWVDPTPGAGTNQYRVATRTSSGSLLSAYTTGNLVSTIVAPAAPTGLSPTGVYADLSASVTFRWTHHDGGDGAAQSHYRIQWSSNGGSTWNTLTGADGIASAAGQHTMAGGVLSNGTNYQWHVQTQGNTTVGYGPYSAAATLNGSAIPVVTIDSAHPAATTTALPMDLTWAYAQDQGSAQAAWVAELYDSLGGLLERQSGTTETTVIWQYAVEDGSSYTVQVQAQSGAGLWSNWASKATTVALPDPAPITITPSYNACTGRMILDMVPQAPGGGQVAADYAYVERRINGGDWVVVTPMLAMPNAILDPLPITRGTNEYRVTAISSTPSYFVCDIVTVTTNDGDTGTEQWVLVSWGDTFLNTLRFHGNPKTKSTSSREREGVKFLGRQKRILLLGDNTDYAVSASGEIRFAEGDCTTTSPCGFDPPATDFEQAGREAGMVCYRDYTGRRFFGYLSDMDVEDGLSGMATVSFTVTEAEFSEGYLGVTL